MRHLLRTAIFVAIILVFFAGSIFPPEQKLRLGKDLRGGVSLIYSVQIDSGENAQDTRRKMIDVLKKRVDPDGLLEIAMVAQGRDRIVITMPRPSEQVAQLRRSFQAELDKLEQASIDSDEFELIMRLDGEERARRIAQITGGNDERAGVLQTAAEAYDESVIARAVYEEANEAGVDAQLIDETGMATAEAELGYELARDDALASTIDVAEVERILVLSPRERFKLDSDAGGAVAIPSPRDRAWAKLLESNEQWTDQLAAIRDAWALYESERRTLDDPNDLIRMLQGAGVLTFRITVKPDDHPDERRLRRELQDVGPRNVRAPDAAWYKINEIENWYESVQQLKVLQATPAGFFRGRGYVVEEYNGEYFILCWDQLGSRLTATEGNWAVVSASVGADQLQKPAINFRMNPVGANLLGKLTEAHVQENMAVLLDDEVYTAPNLLSRISSRGQITGDFTREEIDYIVNVLAAGSLQAKLSDQPISQNSIGPDLGHDNLMSGMKAGVWALCAVSAFMVFYYFGYGLIAVFSLLCNAVLILGAMSLNRAAFTLPGIAGIILTFGMAVDANVLIYERIREELRGGADLRSAVRLGYQKALSSIVDGNVTNLIVCFVLAYFGTQETKGFAITLGIGVVATLFSALVINRVIFATLVDVIGIRKASMLPMVFPRLERLLHPNINWLKLRFMFITISTVYVGIGIFMVFYQGEKMLDIEFRGGTQVTLKFADQNGDPIFLTRAEVERRVKALAEGLDDNDAMRAIRNANVVPVNPQADGVTSDTFNIKTIVTDQRAVLESVGAEFQNELPELPSVNFVGRDETEGVPPPIYAILTGKLGQDVGMAQIRNDVQEWVGGVAIVLENIDPPISVEAIEDKIQYMAQQPDFGHIVARPREIIVIEGSAEAASTVIVIVSDPGLSFYDNEDRFRREVMDSEWRLIRDAMAQSTTPASVQSFSPAIAATFKGQAIGAVFISFLMIMIYIYVRFGSVRYSLAAIITLLHDVLTVIGLIALAEIVYDLPATAGMAASLHILPFKINLALVAALLTIIGYSLNDTIIIMDRIRENRGKLAYASADVINLSINQTISRTVITSGTTLIAVLILYIFGGEGVRAFSFALILGVIVGTYSSIAVAAPLVWSPKADRSAAKDVDVSSTAIAPGA